MFSDLTTEWNVPQTSANLDKQLFSSAIKKAKKARSLERSLDKKLHADSTNSSMSSIMLKSFEQLDGEEIQKKKKQRKKKNKNNKFKKNVRVTEVQDKSKDNSGEESKSENGSDVSVTKQKAAKRKTDSLEESTSPKKKKKLDDDVDTKPKAKKSKKKKVLDHSGETFKSGNDLDVTVQSGMIRKADDDVNTKRKKKKPKKKKNALKDGKVKDDGDVEKVCDNTGGGGDSSKSLRDNTGGGGDSSKSLRYREKKRRRRKRVLALEQSQKKGERSHDPVDSNADSADVSMQKKTPKILPIETLKTDFQKKECKTGNSDQEKDSPTLKKKKKKKPKKKNKSGDITKPESISVPSSSSAPSSSSTPIEGRGGKSSPKSPGKVKKFHLAGLRKVLEQDEGGVEIPHIVENPEPSVEERENSGTGLRERMVDKLSAARFRFLNEKLYTSTGDEALRLFREDPTSYRVYHHGYSRQVERWPSNPCDVIIDMIRKLPSSSMVADFGCGEAKLAKSVPNKVHSFDLKAACAGVIECNMAKVPLSQSSVDVAVYCLSLMGTDMVHYLAEGNRVLKKGGLLLIAEVRSRFSNDVKHFIKGVEKLGFKVQSKVRVVYVFYLLRHTAFLGFVSHNSSHSISLLTESDDQ